MAGNVIPVDFRPPEPEILLTKDQLARRLGRHHRTIEKWTAEGLPSQIKGIRRVYKLSEAIQWAEDTGRAKRIKRLEKARGEVPQSTRGRITAAEHLDPPSPPPISA